MKCVFLSSFKRDLKKIRDRAIQSDIREFILQIESAKSVAQIPNLNPTTLLCMVAFFDFGEEDTHSVEFSQPSFPV